MATLPVFITGNKDKADYLSRQLGIALEHQKVELDEIQETDPERLLEHKLQQAYAVVGAPVLVEDVSLSFDALNGLPGPYIKWFIDQAGAEACCRMLDGFTSRKAEAICTFGYYDGESFRYFQSRSQRYNCRAPTWREWIRMGQDICQRRIRNNSTPKWTRRQMN